MPIYEYECPRCGRVKEQIVKSLDSAVFLTCMHDDIYYPMTRIQFSRLGEPQFKGSGFYATDSKTKP